MTQVFFVVSGSARDSLFVVAMPWLLMLIWSTGFIVAKYGMPYAESITFLFLRFVGVLVYLLSLVWLTRVPVSHRAGTGDTDWAAVGHIAVAGLLVQWSYLAGVWAAVKLGMPAGMTASVVGMQPIPIALCVSTRGECVSNRQQLGLLCSIAGVGLVMANKLYLAGAGVTTPALCAGALLSITTGTLYQKHHCPVFDLRMGAYIQSGALALPYLPFAFLSEMRKVHWMLPTIGSLVWSVLALSIGAILLLFVLIHKGAATKVTLLLYLTPPMTAMMAWTLFGERFPPLAALGMIIAARGVMLVIRKRPGWSGWRTLIAFHCHLLAAHEHAPSDTRRLPPLPYHHHVLDEQRRLRSRQ